MTKLQRVRIQRRVTRGKLAEQAGVHERTIWNHEKGHHTMSEATMFKLADALEVEPHEIAGDVPDVEPTRSAA